MNTSGSRALTHQLDGGEGCCRKLPQCIMSGTLRDEDGTDPAELSTTNGQLLTPALSPVTEHGDSGHHEIKGQRTVNGHTDGQEIGLDGTGSPPIRNTCNTSTLPDSTRSIGDGLKPPRHNGGDASKTLKLSPAKIQELAYSPSSLPLRAATPIDEDIPPLTRGFTKEERGTLSPTYRKASAVSSGTSDSEAFPSISPVATRDVPDLSSIRTTPGAASASRPGKASRSISSPVIKRKQSTQSSRPVPSPLKIEEPGSGRSDGGLRASPQQEPLSSPMPSIIPLPPLSLPTYLQLELSSDRPSALYIHRSAASDFPYESSRIKFERLLNFLLLPPQLEQVLWFGALACLDSWLYTFTILPLRFLKALAVLLQWWAQSIAKEAHDIGSFVYQGVGRVWRRRRESVSTSRQGSLSEGEQSRRPSVVDAATQPAAPKENGHISHDAQQGARKRSKNSSSGFRHRRTRSTPSALLPNHKADLLQGLLIITSCVVLMWFDASRMYHSIRGQAAIKLYVIYNVLEVCDRLFSALGQDVLECLFSKETLERKPDGRSKIIRPLWMFMLALVYNVIHATALFYQVVTLNVAVNSYSNALLTLLMSNQFVEIKGTVFKKFEKENLFQLTCADVVERFQLWLMLLIIALRNIVEVGGLSINLSSASSSAAEGLASNSTLRSMSIIPHAFSLLPRWTGQVLGPFLIVLGSEMLVDWLKHAYITKFNNVKPDIYGRFLDVLAKDYYSHAFADQNLTKRLGLPVIPLSCLFIRASMQTYNMLLATHMPLPIPSTATSLVVDSASAASSPATTAALAHIDNLFRRALGRSSFGSSDTTASFLTNWSLDDLITFTTTAIFFLALYLVLLASKLVLGMCLLSFARSRYKGMKERERQVVDTQGRRVGGWGVVEVGEEKRRWIYEDDAEGLQGLREREGRARTKAERGEIRLDGVGRYMMAAKRIW